jgi:hypothetical protein
VGNTFGGKLIRFICLVACDTIGQILQPLSFSLQLFFFNRCHAQDSMANYKINKSKNVRIKVAVISSL